MYVPLLWLARAASERLDHWSRRLLGRRLLSITQCTKKKGAERGVKGMDRIM